MTKIMQASNLVQGKMHFLHFEGLPSLLWTIGGNCNLHWLYIEQTVAAQWQCATRMPQCTSCQKINTEEAEEVACDEAILVFSR